MGEANQRTCASINGHRMNHKISGLFILGFVVAIFLIVGLFILSNFKVEPKLAYVLGFIFCLLGFSSGVQVLLNLNRPLE